MPNKLNPNGDDHGLQALQGGKTYSELGSRDDLLQKLSEQVPGVIYQYQQWPDGRSCFPYASIGIREIYEVTPEEVRKSAEAVFRRLHPEDLDRVAASIRHSQETMQRWNCEYRVCLPQRGMRWLDGQSVPERMPDGSTIWYGNVRDVTERKLAEEALRESETRQRLALDAAQMGTWEWEIGSENLTLDDRDQNLFGFEPGEFDGRIESFHKRILPEDLPAIHQIHNDAANGKGFEVEFRICLASSKVRWLYGIGAVIPESEGHAARLVGINYDITARKNAEQSLLQSKELLRIFIESAPAGVAMFDRELKYIAHSRRWLIDYGLGDQNLVGRSHYEVFPEVPDRWKEIHRRCLTGIAERCDKDRFERADGTIDYLCWEIQPWRDAAGEIGGLVFFTESINERVRAEERIRTSLREKEALLKEIHHRVKNNLQVISSLLSLQSASVSHPAAIEALAESQNRVRAMSLVHETLYRSNDLARVNLSRYLEELCENLFCAFGVDAARVHLALDVAPVVISLDKSIPCGLLVNEIVSNSLKYAFPGERTGIITVRLQAESDSRVTLILADNGVGMIPNADITQTNTLGLQLVSILTEQLGGHLTIDRNGGTRFDISFTP